MSHHPIRMPRRFAAAVALGLVALIAPLALASSATAAPKPPAGPVAIQVSAATNSTLAGQLNGVPPGSMPSVLAAANTPFDVTVKLVDANGQPATFTTDATVVLSPVPSNGPGSLTTTTATIAAGTSTQTISTSYDAAIKSLAIKATVTNKRTTLSATTSPAFPIELNLNVVPGTSGPMTVSADGKGCTGVDAAHPMCGIVTLPNGVTSSNLAVSLGVCPVGLTSCSGGLVTQFLAGLGSRYTNNAPARMTIVCDKSLCGKAGVNKFTALWSPDATSAFVPVKACVAKGQIPSGWDYCTDYVSSTRDNAGDLLLVVLFTQDLRGIVKT